MISVDEIRNFILFNANKAQGGSNPTPTNLNLAIKRAQQSWITDRYNNPKKYSPAGKPPYGHQESQKITDDISFLLVKSDIDVDSNGTFAYPSDYMHSSSIRYKFKKRGQGKEIITKETDVTEISDSEIGNILSSSIVNPTKRYPYCTYYADHLQLYPKDLGKVTFTYLRLPVEPKWAYTLVNNRPVYDAGNSVDLEAPEDAMNEITFIALGYLGIHIRDAALTQYSEMQKQKEV